MADKINDAKNPTGFRLRHVLDAGDGAIIEIAWSPDGARVAACSDDKHIRIWDAAEGKLLKTLTGHKERVNTLAWSPNGKLIASGSNDNTIHIWDTASGQTISILEDHSDWVDCLTWSPDGKMIASGSGDQTVRVWDVGKGATRFVLDQHAGWVDSIAWSPNGKMIASAANDETILLWNAETGELLHALAEHSEAVFSVKWFAGNDILVSSSLDKTIRLWDGVMGRPLTILESHTGGVSSVSPSADGKFLASKSLDNTVRLWRCDAWETLTILDEPCKFADAGSVAFHPKFPALATMGDEPSMIRIWDLNTAALFGATPAVPTVHYTNAKVVLIGDTGVGKSGLALVLTKQGFHPTESSHGRHVWTFDSREVELEGRQKETRETLLWDLAGQPGYRLIHQLHLGGVAVALVVFDARSETDPFAGVHYWDRAARQAQRLQSGSTAMKKFLIAARLDRGGIGVKQSRVRALAAELGYDGYFETSAKEGWGVEEVAQAIRREIDWAVLPRVSSTALFQQIKAFLIAEKEGGRLLSTVDDLYRAFLRTENAPKENANLRAQFETCIGRVESRDLIRRLNFGNLVLLQPELLDAYASALVNAAKEEPDGLGSISEETALVGDFHIPLETRIKDKQQEKLLLIATIEELLRHEIVLREHSAEGTYLVFPSQLTRERPDLPDPEGKSVVFEFQGPILNVYSTLAVRLAHSGAYRKKELWENAATFTAKSGGTCGLYLHEVREGQGELTLFFDVAASPSMRHEFEEFVHAHLKRRALKETIRRHAIFACPNPECRTPVAEVVATRRKQRGYKWIECPVCGTRVPISDEREEGAITVSPSVIQELDKSADARREFERAASILSGKMATNDFDVFLCHNTQDKAAVKVIAEELKSRGILPWLDEWNLRPGQSWQKALEEQIERIKSAAVFVGPNGIGPWQDLEQAAFLREFQSRSCPVIPVILPEAKTTPKLPVFLAGLQWVDFRIKEPNPLQQLIWGITGRR